MINVLNVLNTVADAIHAAMLSSFVQLYRRHATKQIKYRQDVFPRGRCDEILATRVSAWRFCFEQP